MKKIDDSSKNMMFDPTKDADHAQKVFLQISARSSMEIGTDEDKKQLDAIIQAACDFKTYNVPDPRYDQPIVGVAASNTELTKMLMANANKVTQTQHTKDLASLSSNRISAYHFILSNFVGEGNEMLNRLKAHTDFKGMVSSKSYCPVRLTRAIKHVLITNPSGEKTSDLNTSLRKSKATLALMELSIADFKDLNGFVNEYNDRTAYLDTLSVSPMTEADRLANLLVKVEADPYFRGVYHDIKQSKTREDPKTCEDIFAMMRLHRVQIGAEKTTGGSNYVLATTAMQEPKPELSVPRRDRSSKSDSRKPGTQKDGRVWVDPKEWATMSVEDRKKHGDRNAVLKDKAKKAKEKEKKAALMVKKLASNGENSSGEDSDSPYGKILVVSSKQKAAKQMSNRAKFETHMSAHNAVSLNGRLPLLTTESTESSGSSPESSTDSDRSSPSRSSVRSSSSSSSSDDRNRELELFERLRDAVAVKQPPRPAKTAASEKQRDHLPQVPIGQGADDLLAGKLMTTEDADKLARRAAEFAIQSYIGRLALESTQSEVVVTYSCGATETGANGAQTNQQRSFSLADQGVNHKNVPGQFGRETGTTSPQRSVIVENQSQVEKSLDFVDPDKSREVFPEVFPKVSEGFLHSKVISSEQEEMHSHRDAQHAHGTGILSRLSWLIMVIVVAISYALGAMRNGGSATAITSAVTPPAAVVRNHGGG